MPKQLLFWFSIITNCLFGMGAMWSFGTLAGALLTFSMCLGYSCAFSMTEEVETAADHIASSFAYSFIISANVLIWVVAYGAWVFYTEGRIVLRPITFYLILGLFVILALANLDRSRKG